MEITNKEKKIAISGFTGERKCRSRVTKIPFTTLLVVVVSGEVAVVSVVPVVLVVAVVVVVVLVGVVFSH